MYVKVSSLIFCFSDKAVDCGRLSPPMNGSLLSNETTYPNEVEISCDEGFILRGSFRRKCQADKTWSGESVFCEGNKFMCTYLKLNVSFGLLNPDLTFWTKKLFFPKRKTPKQSNKGLLLRFCSNSLMGWQTLITIQIASIVRPSVCVKDPFFVHSISSFSKHSNRSRG